MTNTACQATGYGPSRITSNMMCAAAPGKDSCQVKCYIVTSCSCYIMLKKGMKNQLFEVTLCTSIVGVLWLVADNFYWTEWQWWTPGDWRRWLQHPHWCCLLGSRTAILCLSWSSFSFCQVMIPNYRELKTSVETNLFLTNPNPNPESYSWSENFWILIFEIQV